MLKVEEKNYTITLAAPEIYVNNFARGRSGHMTHAMAEFQKGKFIDFNSSCSPVRAWGHSAYGFVEYRVSDDFGKTYSESKVLPFSWSAFMDGMFTVSVEKAVACADGSILAFCLRNTMLEPVCCEPWLTPMAVRSRDGGVTWEEPFEASPYPGRIYDAICVEDKVFFLEFKYEHFTGKRPEHKYSVFVSGDNGMTFTEIELPIDGIGRGYGSLLYDDNGVLHAYAYNVNDEQHMDHAVSTDLGKTWKVVEPCYLNCGIRNPQTALIDGVYICHGRGAQGKGFVFYSSEDGYNWSEAFYGGKMAGGCYYSNNLLLDDNGHNFLLIQYSELVSSEPANIETSKQVNVMHTVLTVERKHNDKQT